MHDQRENLLDRWASYIDENARNGALTGQPIAISDIETVIGPRAGAIEILAGLQTRYLFQALRRDGCADLRQCIPWPFVGEPQVVWSGRWLRLEAGWPDGLAQSMIRLADLCKKPKHDGHWTAGLTENGAIVRPALNDTSPHYLVSGCTGSGKSVSLRNALVQLLADPHNQAVLVDGKAGESLRAVEHLPGVLGPVAVDGPSARAALGWACAEMRQRYETGWQDGKLIICVDEFQELTTDPTFADLMRKLAAQGRAAQVHLLAATQHPTVGMFNDPSTRRNLTGKLALRVDDPDSSRVAVGGATPRADRLLGKGDTYLVGAGFVHRIQGAYVDESDISKVEDGSAHRFSRWPEYDAEALGQELPTGGPQPFTADQRACGLVAAANGEGRRLMNQRMEAFGSEALGSARAKRLARESQETHDSLIQHGYGICRNKGDGDAANEQQPIFPDIW